MHSILVIDDDHEIQTIIAEVLTDEGYHVHTAANGVEGLAAIERECPAMVLLDMRMSVLDGWEFARTLAAHGKYVPIVVMTAAQDARHWAQEIGAVGVLAKPFNLIDLLDTVARVMQARHS